MKILIYKPYFLSQQENSHLSGKTDQTEKKKKKITIGRTQESYFMLQYGVSIAVSREF